MADFGNNLIKNIIRTLVMAPVYTTAGYIAYRTGRWFYNHEMRRLGIVSSKETQMWGRPKSNDRPSTSSPFWFW
ncbi:hypothetical protein K7X08_026079 [Anisodus acutangulus]|uniref:Uncharacterized protein n=1 Tax=Anisodus acutangulus TaxID=402998 RepID=A0A9Q1N214_9SOLA|nr:hypothetical protein K7X08_026079 [Anisodus acutangulus]